MHHALVLERLNPLPSSPHTITYISPPPRSTGSIFSPSFPPLGFFTISRPPSAMHVYDLGGALLLVLVAHRVSVIFYPYDEDYSCKKSKGD